MNELTFAEGWDWLRDTLPLLLIFAGIVWGAMKLGLRAIVGYLTAHNEEVESKVERRHTETQGELKEIKSELRRLNGTSRENRERIAKLEGKVDW